MNSLIIPLLAIVGLFILAVVYVGVSIYEESTKEKKRFSSPYVIKGSVNTESELPRTGVAYGDVYKVLEPYPEYYVWCEGNIWKRA